MARIDPPCQVSMVAVAGEPSYWTERPNILEKVCEPNSDLASGKDVGRVPGGTWGASLG